MKKRGFTLAELLGVIVILGLVSLITVPAVTQSIKKYKQDLYDIQIENIITAAKTWASDHILELPDNEGDTYMITIADLQKDGYIKDELQNPVTKDPFKTTAQITIKRVGKGYEYSLDESGL